MIGLGSIIPSGLDSFLNPKTSGKAANYFRDYRIENEIILHGRRDNQAWFAPAAGVIPGKGNSKPRVFVTVTSLTGDDVGPHFYLKSDDLGKTWSNPVLCQNWFKVPMDNNVFERPLFGLHYHKKTKTLIAIGRTLFVQDQFDNRSQKNERLYSSPEHTGSNIYSLWNADKDDFEPWSRIKMPDNLPMHIFFHGQVHEKEDGTMLLPAAYPGLFGETDQSPDKGLVIIRCAFDGREMRYIEHGNVLPIEAAGGWSKYSMICFNGRYFLTIRHRDRGSVTSSMNGLHFEDYITWCFDDGEELGNYNTGQKWLRHKDCLYLVYTRKSDLSGGVFRSRAPLFMAEVDTEKLRIRRNTERIVFPEKGARMGNFTSANISANESWVISGEWLSQDSGFIKYTGDLILARITG
jgi:hypothetical protein